MPTNQSYPWGGGSGPTCTGTSPIRTVPPTKVPSNQTSHELNRRKDLPKAPPTKQTKASALENGDRIKTNSKSQVATATDESSAPTQQINRTQNHCPTDTKQPRSSGEGPVRLDQLVSVCQRDLFRGQTYPQQHNTLVLEAAACPLLPLAPPRCLTPPKHQGAALESDASHLEITETAGRSTMTEPEVRTASTRRIHSTNQSPAGSTFSQFKTGHPSPTSETQTEPEPEDVPTHPSARINPAAAAGSHEEENSGSAPAGVLVGSVTNQISAIHLTKRRHPASTPPPSPSLSEEGVVGEHQLIGPECAMQVDGPEEEFPDELENACSDDEGSDCSSITGASSTASIGLLSSVEEPMLLEVEDDREEKPPLVPSLFPHFPPTLYFSTANEKVGLLPVEQRRMLKWKMSTVTPNVVKNIVARSHFKVTKRSHDWLGCWGHHMKSPCFKALGEHQKLNHFPGTFQIGRKDRLWRNLSKMQVRFGKQEFSFFPRTFVLPQDIKLLRKAWEDGGSRQKWIIKPPASARGIGIQVIHKWSQMPRKRPLLVQKYLHKPYLISGNKFDLRIYVYVTSYDPLRVYIFTDGLVRFASCKYSSSMKTLGNKFMHLTNYSVNKKNSEYQANSDDKACQGHKWALKALWQYLGSKGINTTLLWDKIKDIVIKTVIASEPYVNSLLKMNVRSPNSCHELFGFDIMLDENLKPWILEVNISPSLHSNTALDVAIKGQMIRDLLNLAGFRIPQREEVSGPSTSPSGSSSSLCGGTRERTRPDVTADEKVKRAFYLSQRYADQDFYSSVLDVLTPDDVRVLAETEDELTRKGEFERVFPSPSSSRYLRFFECPRYLNVLLDQWEQKHWNNRTKGISLLTTLCQKGVHLGTNDPAHMWSKCSYTSRFETHRPDVVSPSRSRVVVSHQPRPLLHDDDGAGSDGEVASASSLPASPSPGSSACTSPQPSLTHSLLPQHFAAL